MHRIALALVLCALAACSKSEPARHLDLDLIRVSGDAKLRTDTVGGGRFVDTATFVLVEAENRGREGAYVTLGGELTDHGTVIGTLQPQSLWIPAGESRTFALVDGERKPRPAAASARIVVRGALVASAPRARIEELTTFDDHGKMVAQAYLVNDAPRIGNIVVIASFKDAGGRPMTRPFSVIQINANKPGERFQSCSSTPRKELSFRTPCSLQFVGPEGSTSATIYVGDVNY